MSRYGAALAGWVLGGMAAPVMAVLVLLVVIELMCKGTAECSWGLEFLLVLPILFGAFFLAGPRLVARFSEPWLDASARRRVARTTRIAAAASLLILYLVSSNGLPAFGVALLIVTLGVPALVVWRTPPGAA